MHVPDVIHDYKNASATMYFYQDKTRIVFNNVRAPVGRLMLITLQRRLRNSWPDSVSKFATVLASTTNFNSVPCAFVT